jgi:hypothetical protein
MDARHHIGSLARGYESNRSSGKKGFFTHVSICKEKDIKTEIPFRE